jgi:hypothetical protein
LILARFWWRARAALPLGAESLRPGELEMRDAVDNPVVDGVL